MAATDKLHDQPEVDLQALAPGAGPEVIREHLLPEDRERFDAALAHARTIGDDNLWDCIERWRGIAVLQADRNKFRCLAREFAEHATGHPSPEDEPLEVTRAKAHI